MLGIKFELPNEYCDFLGKIFNGIYLKETKWNVVNSEVFNEKGNDLFEKETYNNSEFYEIINNNKYYLVFLTLISYNSGSKRIDINNYEDYLNSDCNLLLCIIDNIFVEIYAKNKNLLNQIKCNVKLNNFKNFKYIKNEKEFRLY